MNKSNTKKNFTQNIQDQNVQYHNGLITEQVSAISEMKEKMEDLMKADQEKIELYKKEEYNETISEVIKIHQGSINRMVNEIMTMESFMNEINNIEEDKNIESSEKVIKKYQLLDMLGASAKKYFEGVRQDKIALDRIENSYPQHNWSPFTHKENKKETIH